MSAPRYYDRDGLPIDDMLVWGMQLQDEDYKRVAKDEGDGWMVSTVWLGLDHNWDPNGPPLIFETMIFGGPLDEEQARYSTLDEAIAGHAVMLERARHSCTCTGHTDADYPHSMFDFEVPHAEDCPRCHPTAATER